MMAELKKANTQESYRGLIIPNLISDLRAIDGSGKVTVVAHDLEHIVGHVKLPSSAHYALLGVDVPTSRAVFEMPFLEYDVSNVAQRYHEVSRVLHDYGVSLVHGKFEEEPGFDAPIFKQHHHFRNRR